MTVCSYDLKKFVSLVFVVMACIGLASYGEDEMIINPRSLGQPDLVVGTPSVNDSSPATGGSLTLAAAVRNAGNADAPATTLRYYRSTDATITTSDTSVGSDAVSALVASASASESIDVTAPATAGTYYYGACVDAVADESDTTNNCSSSVQVTVAEPGSETQGQPDLIVTTFAVKTSPSGTPPGGSIGLKAGVKNDGDGDAPATTLRYYRSTDKTITTSDTSVGTDAVSGLAASASGSESIDVTAPSTAGTYYYGACVDTVTDESNTKNNCSASVQVTVSGSAPRTQTQPDLVVGTPSVNDSSPATGGSFTLSATVSNDGDGNAAATTLRYYRSTDATITTSDTSVGTDAVGALAVAGTSAQSIGLTAPSTAGTYYYGACVDAVTDESDTTNNCSASVQVDVSEQSPSPDLSVGAPTVYDSTPTPYELINIYAPARNQGDAASAATTLRYYLSTDATITTSDTEVDTVRVPSLAPSGNYTEESAIRAPSTIGTYYYGACVDAVADESDTTNNCSSSFEVVVSESEPEPPPPSEGQPDLVVIGPSVSDGSVETGETFAMLVTVTNQGDEKSRSAATTLRYYRSTDATVTTSDTSVGTDAVGELTPPQGYGGTISLTAPSTADTYYYGACVDAVADESDTTNNCSTSVRVDVHETEPETQPDLTVGTPSVDDSSPPTGESFTLSVTVSNDGDAEALATTLRYYRSTDVTITTSDTSVGTDAVSGLAASGTSSESIDVTAPSTAGTYFYGACVDLVSEESNTNNNCSASVQVTVSELETLTQIEVQPDLVVGTPSVDDSSPETGGSFTLSATVSNDGDGDAPATTLRYYRSTDATITTSDTSVGTDAVGALAVAGTSAQSIGLTAPSTAGTYYYGACVDAVTDESDTTNNCSASVQVDVSEQSPSPDLSVGAPTVYDSTPTPYELINIYAPARNQGDAASAATTLRYYLSTDATITTSDTEVDTVRVPSLAPSGNYTEESAIRAPSTIGTYYYGACVDAVADESDTTNNCSSSFEVVVSESEPEPPPPSEGQPDLVVIGPSVSDGSVETGETFAMLVTVTNQGDEKSRSAATTLRYYRSTDATVTTSDTSVGTDAVGELTPPQGYGGTISLTAPSTADTYYYGACVDAVADESDTTNNCSTSVRVDVHETEPETQPDLTVGTPSVNDSTPATSGSFTLSATVSNDGDASALATTLRYYRSTDSSITTSDTSVGTDAVAALAASATSDESIDLTAPATAGIYYYGACVDSVSDESDTNNNCSSSVAIDAGGDN